MTLFLTYVLNLAFLAAILYLFYRAATNDCFNKLFVPMLAIKAMAGIGFALLYQIYYGEGDAITYYHDANLKAQLDFPQFWKWVSSVPTPDQEVRRIFFTKLVAILIYCTGADFWLATLYFDVVGFFALWYLISSVRRVQIIVPAFVLVPSVLFWSSGLIKEGLAYPALIVLVGGLLRYRREVPVMFWEVILWILSLIILSIVKYYIAAVFIPLAIYVILDQTLQKSNCLDRFGWRFLVLLFVLSMPCYWLVSMIHPHLSLSSLVMLMVEGPEFLEHGPVSDYNDEWRGIDIFALIGHLWSGFFRPVFPEKMSFPAVFVAIENIVLLILILWKVSLKKTWQFQMSAMGLAGVVYVVVLALFLSASSPTLGALVRYKIYYLPVIWYWVLNHHPILNALPRSKWIRDFV